VLKNRLIRLFSFIASRIGKDKVGSDNKTTKAMAQNKARAKFIVTLEGIFVLLKGSVLASLMETKLILLNSWLRLE